MAECQMTECQKAECQMAECQKAECQMAECQKAGCQLAECQFTVYPLSLQQQFLRLPLKKAALLSLFFRKILICLENCHGRVAKWHHMLYDESGTVQAN